MRSTIIEPVVTISVDGRSVAEVNIESLACGSIVESLSFSSVVNTFGNCVVMVFRLPAIVMISGIVAVVVVVVVVVCLSAVVRSKINIIKYNYTYENID